MSRNLVWFSCGAASAVAAKLAVDKYDECEVLYCDTLAYEHPDNLRFLKDIEKWIGQDIKILKSSKYTDIYDVFRKSGYLVGPYGARCTTELKKNVRKIYQQPSDNHIFGLTHDEENRIDTFEDNYPDLKLTWILKDARINKDHCYARLVQAGITLPTMYKLGYNNNNCIGCVKGGAGYWNKIRIDFPEMYEKMAIEERRLGIAINKSYAKKVRLACGDIIDNPDLERIHVFLDELHPKSGRGVKQPDIECGVLCVAPENTPLSEGKECQIELF